MMERSFQKFLFDARCVMSTMFGHSETMVQLVLRETAKQTPAEFYAPWLTLFRVNKSREW